MNEARLESSRCRGCTWCCLEFKLDKDQYEATLQSHPGLLQKRKDFSYKGTNYVVVNCNERVIGGCCIHPTIIGRETRPSFCQVPPCTIPKRPLW